MQVEEVGLLYPALLVEQVEHVLQRGQLGDQLLHDSAQRLEYTVIVYAGQMEVQLDDLETRLLQVPGHLVVDVAADRQLVALLSQHVRLVDEHLEPDARVNLVRAGDYLVEVGQRRLVDVGAVYDVNNGVAVGEEPLVVEWHGRLEYVHLSGDLHELVVQEAVSLDVPELDLGGAFQQQRAVGSHLVEDHLRNGGFAAAPQAH